MFEQSVVASGRTRRSWTIAVALLVQGLLVAVLIVVPLLYVQVLPAPELSSALPLVAPPPPPAPPATRPSAHHEQVEKIVPRKFNPHGLIVPTKSVATAATELPAPPVNGVAGGIPGGIPEGQAGGAIGGILGFLPNSAPPPPPAAATEPANARRIHMGGSVEASLLLHKVTPVYPQSAKDARIGGVVRMKAIIGRQGDVEDLIVLSGDPMLIPAAEDAVKQWVYKPTYLNGAPVEVVTEIDVRFQLAS
jgi:protein TonB